VIAKINEIVAKIPITLLLMAYLLFLGYQWYDFKNGSDSALNVKKSELEDAEKKKDQLNKKLVTLSEFAKNVEKKKRDLLQAMADLSALKDAIPEQNELPTLMNVLVTEAKRVGLSVKGINPQPEVRKEYYIEQPVKLEVGGAYFQLLAFTERLTSVSQVIQIGTLDVAPSQDKSPKGILLAAKMDVKFFKYLGTQADNLGKQDSGSQAVQNTSSSPQGGQK
jgi:type IV pilus assembly protein PilO